VLTAYDDLDTAILFIAKSLVPTGRIFQSDFVSNYERGVDLAGFDFSQ